MCFVKTNFFTTSKNCQSEQIINDKSHHLVKCDPWTSVKLTKKIDSKCQASTLQRFVNFVSPQHIHTQIRSRIVEFLKMPKAKTLASVGNGWKQTQPHIPSRKKCLAMDANEVTTYEWMTISTGHAKLFGEREDVK